VEKTLDVLIGSGRTEEVSIFKLPKLLSVMGIVLVSALALSDLVYARLQIPLGTAQQTVVTASTRVVVVLIPGFPVESVLTGLLLGLVLLHVVRRRRVRNRIR